MTGWARGTLSIEAYLYEGGTELDHMGPHTCSNSTSCSLPDAYFTSEEDNVWKVVATGCGPGGCETESTSGGAAPRRAESSGRRSDASQA